MIFNTLNRHDVYEALRLGADAVCIGTLFAVSAESDLSVEEKLKFADAAGQPRSGDLWATHRNPDGSTVKLGNSDAFTYYGDNRRALRERVSTSASQIVDEIMCACNVYMGKHKYSEPLTS